MTIATSRTLALTIGVLTLFTLGIGNARAQKQKHQISQQQYLSRMHVALDGIIENTRDQATHPLLFAANLFYAHEGVIEATPLNTLKKKVAAFTEAGFQRIDINMGFFPWLDNHEPTIKKYDALIDYIRNSGMQLAINPQFSTQYHQFNSFEELEDAILKIYPIIARRYKPDVFVVVHEPTTMEKRLGFSASPKKWRELVQKATRAVKGASPKSRCGAGGLGYEKEYFKAFLSIDELEVMTIDIYSLRGLRTYNQMIKMAKAKGKSIYIEETWRPTYYQPQAVKGKGIEAISAMGVGDEAFTALDAKWIEAMAMYASAWELEAVTLFWTQTFFKYVKNGGNALEASYNRQVAVAIDKEERTALFQAVERLIKRLGKKNIDTGKREE